MVVEGAAGAGKTATLAATRAVVEQQGRRMLVVTPTLKAAQVAAGEIGARAFSAAWLATQYGFNWDTDGHWTRTPRALSRSALLLPGDLLLVDEAGMLDQDTARALLSIADETGARIAFLGDRHQLPAVGRGGVLDLAATWANPETLITLGQVHRFADPAYAELSLAMRTGADPSAVFDQLLARGQVVVHPSDEDRTRTLVTTAADTGALVVADTREQVADLNAAIRERLVASGRVEDRQVVVTDAGERIGVGDRVATRRNDYHLGVANRDTWTVTSIEPQGRQGLPGVGSTSPTVAPAVAVDRVVDAEYARRHVELAYATTVYGAQGETTTAAHLAVGEHTGAASAYVAMTRGRRQNTAHLVADDLDQARRLWVEVFSRDRADLGPAHAARLAAQEAAKYATPPPNTEDPRRYVPRWRRPSAAPPTTGAPRHGPPVPTPVPDPDHGRSPGIGF